VRRGLAQSREQAQTLIARGAVLVAGAPADKPSRLVAPGEAIVLVGAGPRFVGRGGEKLDAALGHFAIEVLGRRALDAGASTGGFTDCLLQRGAARVVAVDVGRGQLHESLRADPRVVALERTDIRSLALAEIGQEPFDLIVGDLSFISLRTVASALFERLAAAGADVVVLIKPQFEAGRQAVARGRGVVRDPAVWAEVLSTVGSALARHGAAMMGVMVSPLTGADGNVEFLAHLRAHGAPASAAAAPALDVAAVVAGAVALYGDPALGGRSGPDR
jgi:23S rRNA (cytidine1920-2'-O)/16S rRNA (cytidine1409-2'-O)-methyltransferase